MGTTKHRRRSRNCIRLVHEVVRRFHALDTCAVYGRHWLVEPLSTFAIAPHTASGDCLRGLDRHWRGRHRDSGNGGARRLRCAAEDTLPYSDFGGRYRTQAGLGKLRTIAGRGSLNPLRY